jgi:hypothetical protein
LDSGAELLLSLVGLAGASDAVSELSSYICGNASRAVRFGRRASSN